MTTPGMGDPPPPKPPSPDEGPGAGSSIPGLKDPGDPAGVTSWVFNPEYQELIDLWQRVLPLLDESGGSLDPPLEMARNPEVWEGQIRDQYVQGMGQWRNQLAAYRQSVLSAISEQAARTPRWIPVKAPATAAPR